MDIKVALSIYNKPWYIERESAFQMLQFWSDVQAGRSRWSYGAALPKSFDDSPTVTAYEVKKKFFSTANVIVAPDNRYDMKSFNGFVGATVAVISISGPLMKADYCGSFGTESIRQIITLANNTESIKTILFIIDSPGGTVDGTQLLADAIKNSPKQTIGLIDGYCCSAAYWIGSSMDELYAGAKTDIIGSIGTMMGWLDRSKAMEAQGYIVREYYATESTDKNAAFKAADKGDGERLIAEFLDPINSVFLTAVKDNRAGKIDLKNENVLTGKTYPADQAVNVGLIDGISSFDQIVSSAQKTTSKKSNIQMSTKNHVFQLALAAANAEAFAPVDGGFLLTEEHLNNIDAALKPGQSIQNAVTTQLTQLQAKEADFNASAEKIQKLEQELKTTKASLDQAQKDLGTANEELLTLRKGPGAVFNSVNRKEDPHEAHSTETVDQSKFAHNQIANEYFG